MKTTKKSKDSKTKVPRSSSMQVIKSSSSSVHEEPGAVWGMKGVLCVCVCMCVFDLVPGKSEISELNQSCSPLIYV